MQTTLILPALNEAESIGRVLASIPRDTVTEIIVVDGGSQDDTIAIAQAAQARVVHEPRRGYGRACATGVAHARGKIVAFMDADGADDPKRLPELLSPIVLGKADLALGSRLAGGIERGAMPWHQHFGNWLAAEMIGRLYGVPLTDLSPFRAIRRASLLELDMQEMTYGWPTEMITKAARRKWRIVEVPVIYHPRLGGKSKISGTLHGTVLATYFILRTILYYSRNG